MKRFMLKWKNPGDHAGEGDLIDRYLDGLLSEGEKEEFEARYFRDDALFMEVRERERFRRKVANVIQKDGREIFTTLPAHPAASNWMAKRSRNLLAGERHAVPRWAFALAMVGAAAIAGIVIYLSLAKKIQLGPVEPSFTERDQPQADSTKASDSLKLEIDVKQLYAANFAPVPHLDDWLAESTRSESAIIERVLSPRIGEEISGAEIIFRWTMSTNVLVSLRIVDNHEEELVARSPDPAQFPVMTVRVKTDLLKEPGLFYWKIEDKTDVVFVGKFLFLPRPEKSNVSPGDI